MTLYAKLRETASTVNLSPLRDQRPPPDSSAIDEHRVHLLGCAFLRFNCDYGDMIRWLEGPYTDSHRDWSSAFAQFEEVRHATPPPGFPPPDYERTFRSCLEGVPLRANYYSDYHSCSVRNTAALSADLIKNQSDIDETLRKEEKLSYHVILPRFLWRFFGGIFLSIFRVAYRWGDPKPRLCVDPSTRITPSDHGNVNRHIPDPGVDEDQNPTIYYGTAFLRYLVWLWNLRITYPTEDILQMTDDISAAFHRVLYHPDVAPGFASVWRQWLIVPASAIFGSKSSPGNYMWKGEMRAHLSNHMALVPSSTDIPLVARLRLPPPPTDSEKNSFCLATADSLHQGIIFRPNGSPERRHPSFVDDTGVAHIRQHFMTAASASVHSAYVMFGHPEEDANRPPCINPDKWKENVNHQLQFLGYHIDTRTMAVSWPITKREKLAIFLNVLLDDASQNNGSTPHSITRVLGLVRHAAPVAPMGIFRSLRLQHLLNDLLSKAPTAKLLRRWYQRRQVRIPEPIIHELNQLKLDLTDTLSDPNWSRPIGLIIPRDPTITVFTDASTNGLGGWSRETTLNHMWRLRVSDLVAHGFPAHMGWNNLTNFWEPDLDRTQAHINILEFVAIFIELWVCLRQIETAHLQQNTQRQLPAEIIPAGGHRLLARADNTSALSWLRYATRTKRPPVRRLARLLTSFLCHPFASSHVQIQGRHIKGTANVSADHLSRFEKSPSWAAAMANSARLRNLRICLLPPNLLSLLASVYLQEQTEAWYGEAMTKLWTLAPPIFVTGSQIPAGITSSVVPEPLHPIRPLD
jgi:hypothetical protein